MNGLGPVAGYLRSNDDFLIATHITPDGDALGSALSLSLVLDALGKKSLVYDRDGVPAYLSFLPESGRVLSSLDGVDTERLSLVLVDCNAPHRAALEGVRFARAAVIDHHDTEGTFGDIRWVEPAEPAVGLMVYRLIEEFGLRLTSDIATNIYAAMAIDTGTFRYPNTTAESLAAAARLVAAGADPGAIADRLYNTWSRPRFALYQTALASLEIEGAVSVMAIPHETFAATGTSYQDTENFVNFPLMMQDVLVSAALREASEGLWRVSLRSKNGVADVASVAERFEGGGHKNAAGCTMRGTLAEVRAALLLGIKSAIQKQ